jgi:hypothetical protein
MSNYRLGLDLENKLALTDEDVLAPPNKTPIVTLAALIQSLNNWASKFNEQWPNPKQAWFTEEGVPCEILRTKGGGWQKGKLRFRLEFIPDNPDAFLDNPVPKAEPSTLDALRAELNLDK